MQHAVTDSVEAWLLSVSSMDTGTEVIGFEVYEETGCGRLPPPRRKPLNQLIFCPAYIYPKEPPLPAF